ncbi:hypothetical protein MFRU_007g03520 [Monilinia fructicola]|nr:hypothetical protein MFRU_007g03520 [Monilinia fructicola]
MTYFMTIYVDGGRRNKEPSDPYGAAVVLFKGRHGEILSRSIIELPRGEGDPPVTNQRAKLIAIIFAQGQALSRCSRLFHGPNIRISIYSDSREVVTSINERFDNWRENGWRNSRGDEVVNRDLLQEIDYLNTQLKTLATVRYIWISKFENIEAFDALLRCIADMRYSVPRGEEI